MEETSPLETIDWRTPQPAARLSDYIETTKATADANTRIAMLAQVLDGFLQNRAKDAAPQAYEAAVQALRESLGPYGQGNMAIAQINPTPGDLAGNAEKIIRYATAAEAIGVDMVVFPEMALMGYPIRDLIVRHPFIVAENLKWLREIAKRTGKTAALVGFVERRVPEPGKQRVGKEFYNSLAVLQEGEIRAIVRKSLMPTYNEFEDYRQFEPAPASGAHHPETLGLAEWGFAHPVPNGNPYGIHGHTYGLSICEDTWNDDDFFNEVLYKNDPIAELAVTRPHAFINVSASPTRSRKEQLKHNMLSHLAKKYATPYVYVNQVGAIDETSFDGASRVYDAHGELIARARFFEEQLLIVNPYTGLGTVYPFPTGLGATLDAAKVFNAYDTSDLGRAYQSILQGIRDYFAKTGFKRAVLGLSGGLDSSVVAVLLADALGPKNVVGISMPSVLTPQENRSDAEVLARNLGIHFTEAPIAETVDALSDSLQLAQPDLRAHWGESFTGSNAADNAQAMIRAMLLRQVGNEYQAFPVATSDKSELYLGYATINGDMSGALAPIGDLPKTKVRAMARWLNENRPVKDALPVSIIQKPSGADLKVDPATGKLLTAEDDLMPYEFADEIIWRIEALKQGKNDMLGERFQYEAQYEVSAEQKRAWLDKFFDRMAKSVFKWWVSPPMIIVEGNGSIAKTDYHHPIVANRIQWEGRTPEAIEEFLDAASRPLALQASQS